MATMARIVAIKTYFQRDDEISPGGGRPVPMAELKALTAEDRDELARLAAEQLGVELQGEVAQ